MVFLAIFLCEFFLLFFLSRMLTKHLSAWVYRVSKSHAFTMHFLAILFLPGVIVHELSHYFTAAILFVHVGEIEFLPKMVDGGLKLGSVAIGKADPIRRALIGLAPILLGIGFLLLAASYYVKGDYSLFSVDTLVFFYIVFQIGNTMFSSAKDLEGFLEIGLAFAFFALVLFIFTRITSLTLPSLTVSWQGLGGVFLSLIVVLGVVIALDSLVLGILSVLQRGKIWQ